MFKFVEMIEGLTFWEALKKLADQHGIALPKQSLAGDEETRLRAALYEMHEIAAEHFRANLAGRSGAAVRAYLAKRGVAEASVREIRHRACRGLGAGAAAGSGTARLQAASSWKFRAWWASATTVRFTTAFATG